ncbi:MAG: LamG domain-containing protein [Pseudomonadales bacterium]|nr:LamG domain-containing protein [Pseudomonadales bacterium]
MRSWRFSFKAILLLFALHCVGVGSAYGFKMEAGTVNLPSTSGQSQLFTFSFQQVYDTAPVVVVLITSAGGDASAPRISNVTTSSFQLAQMEPNSEDGPHASMTVSYFAIEPGVNTLPDGTIIEAGTISTSEQQYNGIPSGGKGWEAVSFSSSFTSPVLIADIQTTANEPGIQPQSPSHPWLTVAVDSLAGSDANMALERSEVYDSIAGVNYQFNSLGSNESIGYIVMESGVQSLFTATGNLNVRLESLRSANAADGWSDGCDAINYAGSYTSSPIVVAQKITHREDDGGWLRECSRNSSSIQLTIDEDDAQDGERTHVSEDVGIMLFSSNFIYDSNAVASPTSDDLMLEAGSLSLSPSQFTSVTFQQVYEYPPAVFALVDDGNTEPTYVRIRNVTTTGFEAVPVEPPDTVDASDLNSTIHYLAVTYGNHTFPDGTAIQVSSVDISNFQTKLNGGSSWLGLNFSSAFSSTPAVVAGIQTMNNEASHTPGSPSLPWLATAIRNVNASGMDLALERAEVNSGTISQSEKVAYLAVVPSVLTTFKDINGSDVNGEFLLTPDSIRGWGTCGAVSFSGSYSAAPLVVGAQNRRDGGDGGWLRRCNITSTNVQLVVDEDSTNDNDRNHTTESAGLAIFSQTFASDFSLVANYHLEGPTWNGTAGEVVDVSGSGLNGSAVNAVLARPAQVCYGAEFDGVPEYISIPDNSTLDIDEELTVMAWVNADTLPTGSDLKTIISKDENFEFHLDSSGGVYWWWNNSSGTSRSFTSTSTVSAGAWNHIAIVYSRSNARQSIFINGVESGFTTYSSESLITNSDDLHIGGDQAYVGREFDGKIDEVKVFKRALSAASINIHRNLTRICAPVLDHYGIQTNGTAITCESSPVTITAYRVDNSTVAPPAGTTLTISTSPNADAWSVDSGSPPPGSFTAGANGSATYVFAGTESSVLLYLQETTATASGTPINISVSDGTYSENPSKDQTLAFVDSGLIFDGDTGTAGVQSIATQTAGLSTTIGIRAVRTDNNTGACVARMTGSQDVEFSYVCINPNSCALTQGVAIDGTSINGDSTGSVYQTVNLNFNGSGESSFSYVHNDAGQTRLLARKSLTASGTDPAITLTGTSNDFVTVPAGFCIEATESNNSCASPYQDCSVFKAAGENFTLQISAVTYESPGESNSQFCSGTHDNTENFQLSSIPLELSLTAPSGGSNSTLAVTSVSFGAGDAGQLTINNQQIEDVGAYTINLNIDSVSYLGETLADSITDVVGRFAPDHLRLVANTPEFEDGDSSWSCSFTYQDQPFEFSTEPEFIFTGYSANNNVTQNYGGDFWKHNSTLSSRTYANQATTSATLTPDSSGASYLYSDQTNYDGSGTLTLLNENFTYVKTNMIPVANDAAFDADVDLVLSVTDLSDSDSICVKADASGSCLGHTFSNIGDTEIRYGRAKMENAYGPETDRLPIPMTLQYWNGTSFVTNDLDNCTTYSSDSSILTLGSYTAGLQSGETDATVGEVVGAGSTFSSGEYGTGFELDLIAPGLTNTGSVTVQHSMDKWLRYDWNSDGDVDDTEDNPSGVAIFGQYRGHDRVIYWREVTY